MIYKEYGKTGCNVSAVGFGGMRFDINNNSDAQNAALLHYARDKGINYLDTAPGYCEDNSEEIYGLAIKEMKDREDFYVSTKFMPHNADTVEKTVEAVKKSLSRLNSEYIDFFHVWCLRKMEHYEEAVAPGAMYDGLLKCQEEGLIRNIVFSSHQPGHEIKQIIDTKKFAGVLLGANILNFPYRWDGVEAAYNSGMGVVAMNPLAGGEIPKHEKALSFLSQEGASPTESALRFMICCPQITITLVGFTTKEHIDAACKIADSGTPFTNEEIDAVKKNISDNMNTACTGCGYCKDCPVEINVPGHMQVYNEKHIFGCSEEEMKTKVSFEYEWGRLVGRAGEYEKCIACGKCETACTQHLPIIERLKEFKNWQPDPGSVFEPSFKKKSK